MFRLFNQVDDDHEEDAHPSTSLLDKLSTAVGWFNPFKLSASSVRRHLYSAMVLFSNMATKVYATQCFRTRDAGGGYTQLNTFFCNYRINDEKSLYQLVHQSCSTFQKHAADCAKYVNSTFVGFGPGTFGGDNCGLYTSPGVADPCVVNVLNQNVKSGYGTSADIAATVGIALGSLAVLSAAVGAGYTLFKRYRHAQMLKKQEKIAEIAERIKDPEEKFIELQSKAKLLGDIESAGNLEIELSDFERDYTCPITLSIMQNPATLPTCKHSFEMAAIMQHLEVKKNCPCCRNKKIKKDSISENTDLRFDILTKLDKFESALNNLEIPLVQIESVVDEEPDSVSLLPRKR